VGPLRRSTFRSLVPPAVNVAADRIIARPVGRALKERMFGITGMPWVMVFAISESGHVLKLDHKVDSRMTRFAVSNFG
jgi:hypothetical protein